MHKIDAIEDIKVSVIVATYRRHNELKRAVKSLLSQTYSNIEIIIVDDNADNEWNKKVESVMCEINDDRIIYIQNKVNQGSAKTRNIAIKNATGEYITFLDDDDIYMPEKIEKQLEKMVECQADYSLTDLALYNEDDSLSEIRKREYLCNENKDNLLKLHLMYHMTGTDTMMFRKDYLNKIGCFDTIDIGDEFYLMQKAILNDGKLCYCNRCDVKAYVHTGNGGLSSGKAKIDGENDLYRFKMKYFELLDRKAVRYIKMRHYAVVGFAYLRMNKIMLFLYNGVISFINYPSECVKLILGRK